MLRPPHQLIGITVRGVAEIEPAANGRSAVDAVDERDRVVHEQRAASLQHDAKGVVTVHVSHDLGFEIDGQ